MALFIVVTAANGLAFDLSPFGTHLFPRTLVESQVLHLLHEPPDGHRKHSLLSKEISAPELWAFLLSAFNGINLFLVGIPPSVRCGTARLRLLGQTPFLIRFNQLAPFLHSDH